MDMNAVENREQERERRVRGARGSRFTDADGGNTNQGDAIRDRSRDRRNCRVYISNIPYDYRWQDLKDDFRRIVGSVEYVQLFHDENGKPRGCGVVEFKDPDHVQKAVDEMNRYEVNGRKLVVKEDSGEQRDQYGRIVREGGGGGGGNGGRDHMDNRDRGFSRRDDDNISGRNNFNMMSNVFNNSSNYNLYGLSASFLESLGINGPLHNKVFVANLDYKVDSKKLKQVFKLAGKVQSVELSLDKEGNSRGFAVVEYDHPVEAVQAISMLDRQMLYDRRMTVRLDRIPDKSESLKLPEGLGGIGIGLGPNGDPLKDVARNLPNMMNQNQPQGNISVGSSGGGVLQQQSQQLASQGGGSGNLLGSLGGVMFGNNAGGQSTSVASNTKSLGNAAGGLNLNNLSTNNLAAVVGALSNPLISSSLNNFGLSLANSSSGLGGNAGNNDSVGSGNTGLSNNYSTGGGVSGNNYSSGYGASTGYSSVGGSASGGFNAYSSGSASNAAGNNNASNALDGNDYTTGGGNNLDLYGGGGKAGGGNNTGRKTDTIIIKNLPLSCTWQTLRDKFREVGEIKFAEMRGNDLGLVRFFKERDAECAVALMDGSRLDGRAISVSYF